MNESQATKSAAGPTPTPVSARGLDRDLAFAEAERRLLGRELRPVTLDRFVVLHRVGQGAMGVVYAAHDPKLDRKVALKLVDTSGFGSEGVATARSRIEREARAAADLAHPNVVTIYDTGTVGDQVFLAMEFIDGQTLRQWSQAEHDWREVVNLFVEIGRGLAAAHDKGIVHRDFKPDNVLVGSDGRPRVVDFGLARPVPGALRSTQSLDRTVSIDGGEQGSEASADASSSVQAPETSIAGTPAYMSPEQYEGRNIGPHSDQFGFCVALYEALVGERPFQGATPTALAEAVLEGQRQPLPGSHAVPPRVMAVVLQGLVRDRQRRHRSMHHLIAGLERARDRRRRRWLSLGASTVLAGTVATTYAVASGTTPEASDPCAAAEQPLHEVWNDARRAKIAGGFVALSRQAGQAWAGIEPKLDRYAERWGTMRRDACEDAQHRGEQSVVLLELRYACLDRALVRLDAFASQFESPTAFKAKAGAAVADDIDQLGRCEDRERLVAALHRNGLAEQTDLTRRADSLAKWDQGYDQISRAAAEHALGRRKPAIEMMRGVITDAREAGLRTLEAEAHLLLGRWTHDLAEHQQALDLALAAGTSVQAAEIAITIAEYASVPGDGDPEVAREHLRYAAGFLARRESEYNEALRVRTGLVRGVLAQREGNNTEAHRLLTQALETARARLPPDHQTTLTVMGNRARVMRAMGDPAGAAAEYAKLWDRQLAVLGEHHPDLGNTAFNLGATTLENRQLDVAQRWFERAQEIWTAALGADHHQLAQPLHALGEVHRLRGDLATARTLLDRAVTMVETATGPDHPALCSMLDERADIAAAGGQWAEARAQLERSVVIRRANPDPNLAATLTRLGTALMHDGEGVAGREALEEALVLRSGAGIDPLSRARTELALAKALVPTDMAAARSMADLALERMADAGRRVEELTQAKQWHAATFGEPAN